MPPTTLNSEEPAKHSDSPHEKEPATQSNANAESGTPSNEPPCQK